MVNAVFPDLHIKNHLNCACSLYVHMQLHLEHMLDPDLDVFLLFCVKLKVVAIDENLTVIHQNNVQFDSELPEFR